jgi:hypothetical protein
MITAFMIERYTVFVETTKSEHVLRDDQTSPAHAVMGEAQAV